MLIDTPQLFAEYADYHRDAVNRATHFIGLPLGGVAVFGALGHFELFEVGGLAVTAGLAAVALFTLVNTLVDVRLAIVAIVPALAFYVIGAMLPLAACGGLLVLGLGIPIAGHIWWEKRWPDTVARFGRFELIGHLWFLNLVVRLVPESPALSREV